MSHTLKFYLLLLVVSHLPISLLGQVNSQQLPNDPIKPGEIYRVLLEKAPSSGALGMSLYAWDPSPLGTSNNNNGKRIRIDKVTKGGAATAAGVLPGDLLLAVGHIRVQTLPVNEVATLIQGQPRIVVADFLRMSYKDRGDGSDKKSLPRFVSPLSLASQRKRQQQREQMKGEGAGAGHLLLNAVDGYWETYSVVVRTSSRSQSLGFSFRHDPRLSKLGKDVDRVESGSPAGSAGVRLHDILTHVGNISVKNIPLRDIFNLIQKTRSRPRNATAIALTFARNVTTAQMEIAQQPLELLVLHVTRPAKGQSFGMRLEKDDAYNGFVTISEVVRHSPAAAAGFRPDDIFVAFNNKPLDPDFSLLRFLEVLRSQPLHFKTAVLRVSTKSVLKQAEVVSTATASSNVAENETKISRGNYTLQTNAVNMERHREHRFQQQTNSLAEAWKTGNMGVAVNCMVVLSLSRGNKSTVGEYDPLPLETWPLPCEVTPMRGSLLQGTNSDFVEQVSGVTWLSSGHLEVSHRGNLFPSHRFDVPTVLLVPSGDALFLEVVTSLSKAPLLRQNVVAVVTDTKVAERYYQKYSHGLIADSPVPILAINGILHTNDVMARLHTLAEPTTPSVYPYFSFQIKLSPNYTRKGREKTSDPRVIPVYSSEERLKDFGVDEVSAVKPPLERSDAFAGGSFVLKYGRPGKVTHPNGKNPSQDFPLKVPLEKLMKPHEFDVAFERNALCPTCGGRGGQPNDMIPCPLCVGGSQKDEEDAMEASLQDEPGTIRSTHFLGGEFVTSSKTTCPLCMGYGEIPRAGKQCPHCNGRRVMPIRTVKKINVFAGTPEGHRHLLQGAGNEAPKMNAGDVVLVLNAEEHDNFTRADDDTPGALILRVNITFKEALLGFNKTVTTLNGTEVNITRRSGVTLFGGPPRPSRFGSVVSTGSSTSHLILGAGLPIFDASEPTGKRRWIRMRRKASEVENKVNKSTDASETQSHKRKRKRFTVADEEVRSEEWEDVEGWMLNEAEKLLEDGEGDGRWEVVHGPMIVEFDVQLPESLSNISRNLLNRSFSLFQGQ